MDLDYSCRVSICMYVQIRSTRYPSIERHGCGIYSSLIFTLPLVVPHSMHVHTNCTLLLVVPHE